MKASGSAGSCTRRCCALRRSPSARRSNERGRAGASMPLPCSRPSSAKPGMATGIGAAITTTAPPWARSSSDECSIDSDCAVVGGHLRRRATRARGARHVRGQCSAGQPQRRAGEIVHPAVRSYARTIRATSKPTRRACARTAASTRTPPCGRRWRLRCLGDGDRAGELFSHAESHQSCQHHAPAFIATKWSPMWSCADVYSAPGHVGRGGWTWYTGSAGWMYRDRDGRHSRNQCARHDAASSTRAFRAPGPVLSSPTSTDHRAIASRSRIPGA